MAFSRAVVLKCGLRLPKGSSTDFATQWFVSRAHTSCKGELCPDRIEPFCSSEEGTA